MQMINRQHHPTVVVPPWDPPPYQDRNHPDNLIISPQTKAYFTSLHRYLPCSTTTNFPDDSLDSSLDSESCDEFRMYEFKVRKCTRVRSHDWTDCPFAHPGEKARRRDPRRLNYSATPCPEFRRGSCDKADSCQFAHGVFECWLHPTRYRTHPCNDGLNCRRRVCFFAHTSEELRVVPDSPPMSPSYGSELVGGMRGLQIGSQTNGASMSPRRARICGFGYGSPSQMGCVTREVTLSGLGRFDPWKVRGEKEEVPMERVESGKSIRARMYAKLSKENLLGGNRVDSASAGPDFGWVSELVK